MIIENVLNFPNQWKCLNNHVNVTNFLQSIWMRRISVGGWNTCTPLSLRLSYISVWWREVTSASVEFPEQMENGTQQSQWKFRSSENWTEPQANSLCLALSWTSVFNSSVPGLCSGPNFNQIYSFSDSNITHGRSDYWRIIWDIRSMCKKCVF